MSEAQQKTEGAPHVRLAALGDLDDYRVCAEDTDPRGWSVADANGVVVGSASDLIIDLDGLAARYIVCSITAGDARNVLVPTGFVRLDTERCMVHLDFVTAHDIERLPTFHGLPISAAQTAWMEQVLTGVRPTTSGAAKIVRRSDETRNAS